MYFMCVSGPSRQNMLFMFKLIQIKTEANVSISILFHWKYQ